MRWRKALCFTGVFLAAGLMACGPAAEKSQMTEAMGQPVQNIGGKIRPGIPDQDEDFDLCRSGDSERSGGYDPEQALFIRDYVKTADPAVCGRLSGKGRTCGRKIADVL